MIFDLSTLPAIDRRGIEELATGLGLFGVKVVRHMPPP
jgi:hypothetical protein